MGGFFSTFRLIEAVELFFAGTIGVGAALFTDFLRATGFFAITDALFTITDDFFAATDDFFTLDLSRVARDGGGGGGAGFDAFLTPFTVNFSIDS